jgi:hypothetical protein
MRRCRWLIGWSIGSTIWWAVECSAGAMWLSLWNIARSSSVGLRRTVVEVAQVGRAGHRHENRVPPAETDIVGGVPRRIGEIGRDRRDQVAHQPPVEIDPLAHHLRAHLAPVLQRDGVAELHADVFEDIHRGRVDLFDLGPVHHLAERQGPCEARQHGEIAGPAQRAAGGTSAAAGPGGGEGVGHGAVLCAARYRGGMRGQPLAELRNPLAGNDPVPGMGPRAAGPGDRRSKIDFGRGFASSWPDVHLRWEALLPR